MRSRFAIDLGRLATELRAKPRCVPALKLVTKVERVSQGVAEKGVNDYPSSVDG